MEPFYLQCEIKDQHPPIIVTTVDVTDTEGSLLNNLDDDISVITMFPQDTEEVTSASDLPELVDRPRLPPDLDTNMPVYRGNDNRSESSTNDGLPPLLPRHVVQPDESSDDESSDCSTDDGPPPMLPRHVVQPDESSDDESSEGCRPPLAIWHQHDSSDDDSSSADMPALAEPNMQDSSDEESSTGSMPSLDPREVYDSSDEESSMGSSPRDDSNRPAWARRCNRTDRKSVV